MRGNTGRFPSEFTWDTILLAVLLRAWVLGGSNTSGSRMVVVAAAVIARQRGKTGGRAVKFSVTSSSHRYQSRGVEGRNMASGCVANLFLLFLYPARLSSRPETKGMRQARILLLFIYNNSTV